MSFQKQLREIVEQNPSSKNGIIRNTGIERSTFFKLLSGKRLPTEEQLAVLLRYFENAAPDIFRSADSLLEAYLSERLDADSFRIYKEIKNFIAFVNRQADSCASPQEPLMRSRQMVSDFIAEELSDPDFGLDIYLPLELIEAFHLYDLLSLNTTGSSTIRQVVDIQKGNRPSDEIVSILRLLKYFIRFLDKFPRHLLVYCGEGSGAGGNGLLFPYYLMGKKRLLYISHDGTQCLMTEEASLVEASHRQFHSVIQSLRPLIRQEDSYVQLGQNLFSLTQEKKNSPIISVEDLPCFFQIVNEAVIRKIGMPASETEFGIAYTRLIQSLPNYYSLYSPEGLGAFRERGSFNNAGLELKLSHDDMQILDKAFQRLNNRTMIQLPFKDSIIHSWNILLYYPDLMLISPFSATDRIFFITHRKIVEAFFSFYDNLRKYCQIPESPGQSKLR